MDRLTHLSPKTEKRTSPVHGRGLYAREAIAREEVVAVKGGAIFTRAEWDVLERTVGPAGEVHVSDDLVIAPRTAAEYEASMMHLNHSCDPNVGVEGQIVFVAIRDVAPGEELVLDYAMMDDHDESMECRCGSPRCRGVVTGRDWQREDLQRRYWGYFSAYLARRIARLSASPPAASDRPALVPELYVTDLDASLAFYRDVLGFGIEYERAEERFAALQRGDACLMLEETPALGAATPEQWRQGQWRPADLERPFGRGMNLEIRVDDLDAVAARIRTSPHSPILEVHERTYRVASRDLRVRQLLIADPDGYLIRLSEPRSDGEAS